MALRMRHWIAIVATATALLAIWGLPPRSSAMFFGSPKYAESIISDRIQQTVMRSNEILKRLRWADSLSAIAATFEPGAVFVRTPAGAEPDAETLSAFHERISDELEAGPARDADMRLGFILQKRTHGSHPGVPNPRWPMETYLGERNGTPYCLVVFPAGVRPTGPERGQLDRSFKSAWRPNRQASLLGQCRLPARYGLPGPRIKEWLEAGGMRLAAGSDLEGKGGPIDLGWLVPWDAAQTPFAIRHAQRDVYWKRDVDADRCLTGDTAACARLLTSQHLRKGLNPVHEGVVEATPLTHVEGQRIIGQFGPLDGYILAQLEAEFGPDRFLAFWTSGQAFEDAFQDAFGVDTGVWMSQWVNRWFGEYPAGPGPTRSAGLGSFLLITLCAALAGLLARRRQVA